MESRLGTKASKYMQCQFNIWIKYKLYYKMLWDDSLIINKHGITFAVTVNLLRRRLGIGLLCTVVKLPNASLFMVHVAAWQ